jgi:hypothetical protein
MRHGPTVVTGTYDGNGSPRCLLNWGVSVSNNNDGTMSAEDMANAYMDYWSNMGGEGFMSGEDILCSFEGWACGGLDDPGSTFLLGITKAGDKYENPLKGYIQRITVLRWVEE